MWSLYDDLIKGIPEDIVIDYFNMGVHWTNVKTNENAGVALTVKGHSRPMMIDESLKGMPLRKAAEKIKSWNFEEASFGMAAINSYYNDFRKVEKLPGFKLDSSPEEGSHQKDAFVSFADKVKGKKVTVIGHFPAIERQFGDICELSILERNPSNGDYPDSACEYILPEQDFVFITGMTFTNKTLPRLLQIINKNAEVSLVGPSVPLAPVLFDYGITNLSGYIVTKQDKVDEIIRSGGQFTLFDGGKMVSLYKI